MSDERDKLSWDYQKWTHEILRDHLYRTNDTLHKYIGIGSTSLILVNGTANISLLNIIGLSYGFKFCDPLAWAVISYSIGVISILLGIYSFAKASEKYLYIGENNIEIQNLKITNNSNSKVNINNLECRNKSLLIEYTLYNNCGKCFGIISLLSFILGIALSLIGFLT